MNVLFIIVGIFSGTVIALILNTILANKIEDKNYRIGLKVTSYIICIVLSIAFTIIGSLQTVLDTFIEERIAFIEVKLAEAFPDSNILETSIDTSEFVLALDELQQTVDTIDTSDDDYFENLIFDAFLNKLNGYVYAIKNGINAIAMAGDGNGLVTIKSILYKLKDMVLETIVPYFIAGQIGISILLFVYIGIYIGIVIFLKKGGAMYNKSIVFGDITYDDDRGKSQNKE